MRINLFRLFDKVFEKCSIDIYPKIPPRFPRQMSRRGFGRQVSAIFAVAGLGILLPLRSSAQEADCGGVPIDESEQGCCNGQPYWLDTQFCCGGGVSDAPLVCCGNAVNGSPYDPNRYSCCYKTPYDPKYQGCCPTTPNQVYDFATQCCGRNSAAGFQVYNTPSVGH